MTTPKIPKNWGKWGRTGIHGVGARKNNAVSKCLSSGQVRGYFSDLVLKPDLEPSNSMYPSFEHLVDPTNHQEAVVEARIFNDMKSHLSEAAFWLVIEPLFAVGLEKGKSNLHSGNGCPRNGTLRSTTLKLSHRLL